ncbi:MAG: hypothetical protein KA004_13420 [Verrucomicrobiales bacterium]|nr:hypothetical protein [Verrucomicrobiales bacterium]
MPPNPFDQISPGDPLLDAAQRLWFSACVEAVQTGRENPDSAKQWLAEAPIDRCGDDLNVKAVAKLHCDLAIFIVDHTRTLSGKTGIFSPTADAEGLGKLAAKYSLLTSAAEPNDPGPKSTPVPAGLVMDLAQEMAGPSEPTLRADGTFRGSLRPHIRSTAVPILFLLGNDPAIGWMTLELIENGTGCLYPSPEHLFLSCDGDWRDMERNIPLALKHLGLWRGNADIRWRLRLKSPADAVKRFIDGGTPLAGASAGAIVALGCASLFGGPGVWASLDVSQTAFTAGIHADGTLFAVSGVDVKLAGAARNAEIWPRLGTVGMAALNLEELKEDWKSGETHRGVLDDLGGHVFKEKDHEFYLVGAATLQEAAQRLHFHRTQRWPEGDGWLAPTPPDFIERPAFDSAIWNFIHDSTSDHGALVIVAAAGYGKTTWMTGWLNQLRAAGKAPVHYFIRYQAAASREHIAESLFHQLRRNHLIADHEVPSGTPSNRLKALLPLVSKKLPRDAAGHITQPEILFIEAADQTRHADTLLAGMIHPGLEPGIWCVFTTRQDQHWLTTGQGVRFVDFVSGQEMPRHDAPPATTEAEKPYRDAIRAYLQKETTQLDPPLAEGFIERIAAADSLPGKSQRVVPIFGTVADTVARLLGKKQAEPGFLTRCRTEIAPWLQEWAERATDDAIHLENRVTGELGLKMTGSPARLLWQTLALLDLACRPLSRTELDILARKALFDTDDSLTDSRAKKRDGQEVEYLDAFKKNLTTHHECLLKLAVNFFAYRAFGDLPNEPYTFFHPAYARLVRERLAGHAQAEEECHHLLGSACLELLLDGAGKLRSDPDFRKDASLPAYAFRHAVHHLSRTQRPAPWRDLESLLCALPYMEARWKAGQLYDLLGDWAEALTRHPEEIAETRTSTAWLAEFFAWIKKVAERPLGAPCPPVPAVPDSTRGAATVADPATFTQNDRLHLWFQFLTDSVAALTFGDAHPNLPPPDLAVLACNSASHGPVHAAGKAALGFPHHS